MLLRSSRAVPLHRAPPAAQADRLDALIQSSDDAHRVFGVGAIVLRFLGDQAPNLAPEDGVVASYARFVPALRVTPCAVCFGDRALDRASVTKKIGSLRAGIRHYYQRLREVRQETHRMIFEENAAHLSRERNRPGLRAGHRDTQ